MGSGARRWGGARILAFASLLWCQTASVHSMDMGGMSSATSGNAAAYAGPPPSFCVANPATALCANATEALNSACGADPSASSCSLVAQCTGNGTISADSNPASMVCDPFQLLATLCKLDTGLNSSSVAASCATYASLCANPVAASSVCSPGVAPGLAYLPTTATVTAMMQSMCSAASNNTDASIESSRECADCINPTGCLLLANYSQLCIDGNNSNTLQCTPWASMCAANPTLYLCQATTTAVLSGMYFLPDWDALNFNLIFESWIPRTSGQLCGAFFAVFFLAIMQQIFTTVLQSLERRWQRLADDLEEGKKRADRFPWLEHCLFLPWSYEEVTRMLLQFIISCHYYLLMLAVMSGSAVIFFGVVTGIAVGTLLFHRYRTRPLTVAWATLQSRPVPPPLDAAGSDGSTRVAVWLLRALEVAVGILVLVFVFKDDGGVPSAYNTLNNTNERNLHVIFMIFAFPIAMSESLLAYKEPLLGVCGCSSSCKCNPNLLKKCGCGEGCQCYRVLGWQVVHLVLQIGAVVMAFLGLGAIVYYKANPDFATYNVENVEVYTVHAFIGTLTLFLLAIQFLIGITGFFVIRTWPNWLSLSARHRLGTSHSFLGRLSFMGGVISCMVGFMDMQTMSVDNNSLVTAPVDPGTPNAPPYPAGADLGYAVHSPPSLEASFMGTLLLGVAIAHLFLDGSLAASKRRAADAAAHNAWAAAAAGDSEQPAKKADGGDADASGKHALDTNSVTRLEAPPGGGGGCGCSNGAADGAGAVAPSIMLSVDPSMAPPPPTAAFASFPLAALAWRADWTVLLVRAFEATTIILVFIYTIRDNNGLPDWGDTSNTNTWNWHVVLMVLAFPVLMSEATLAYKAPLLCGCKCTSACGTCTNCPSCDQDGKCKCTRGRSRKAIHVFLQTGIIVMMFLGLASITYYKKANRDSDSPFPSGYSQVYSVHAFIGAITLAAAAGQYLFGACAFLAFRNRMTDERRARLAGWHAFFGKATFSSGVITCMVGLMDMQMLSVDNGLTVTGGIDGVFAQRSSASMECSFMGVVLFGLVASHWYLELVKGI